MSSNGVAILGAGIFAKEAHLPSLVAVGDKAPTLKAVYSRSEKSARDLAAAAADSLSLSSPPAIYHDGAKSTDLDALLARSDITSVIVVLPITLQPDIILKALEAGKHVISEKPVGADVEGGLRLIKEYNLKYKSKGLIWKVAENFEAEAGFRAAGAAIAAGKIGEVIFFNAVVVSRVDKETKWYKTPWRTVPDYQGGFLLDGGVHTIAALRIMLPHALTQLSSFASLNKDYLLPHDTITTVARAGSHFHGTVMLSFAQPTRSRPVGDSFVITGTDGWLSVSQVTIPGSDIPVLRITIKSVLKVEGKPDEEREEIIEEPMRGVQLELESFFAAISGNHDALELGDPLGALRDVAFIQAALTSDGYLVDLTQLVPATL